MDLKLWSISYGAFRIRVKPDQCNTFLLQNWKLCKAKVHTQIDLLKDTDASITADISLTSGNMPSLSGQMSEEMTGNISQSEETTEQDLTETENSTISTVTETGERNKNIQEYSTINQKEIEMIIDSRIDEKLVQNSRKMENFEKNFNEKIEKIEKNNENSRRDDHEGTFKLIKERINRYVHRNCVGVFTLS